MLKDKMRKEKKCILMIKKEDEFWFVEKVKEKIHGKFEEVLMLICVYDY